jgi:hypothetical protein
MILCPGTTVVTDDETAVLLGLDNDPACSNETAVKISLA